jgi:tetratricopeptide (TPR) repeat protein
MHIVFLGNCQAQTLAAIFRRYIGPYTEYSFDFVDAHCHINDSSYERLNRADIVIRQVSLRPPALSHDHIPTRAHVHDVPLVSGAFLWPYQGNPHPNPQVPRYGNPPYPPEYTDRFLAKLLRAGTAPEAALELYRAHDVSQAVNLARVFELTCEAQAKLDGICGFDFVGLIQDHLGSEQLFQSAFHFGPRIAREMTCILCDRLGIDPELRRRIAEHLTDSPFVPRFLPVHPSVARAFGMPWVTQTTTYPFLWEGSFTFDEYVIRFMEARWSPSLQEGIIDAERGNLGAETKAKLQTGLREAPRSARGHHEMSRIAEHDGDMSRAIDLQRHAVALQPSAAFCIRLGRLLTLSQDNDGAADAFARATQADPVSPGAWALLRDALKKRGRLEEAAHAAAQAAAYAPTRRAPP